MREATKRKHNNLAHLEYEDQVDGFVQQGISKVPSDSFLWLTAGSIIGSLALRIAGRKSESLFVGQWAPTFAILGVFDKLIRSKKR